MEVIFSVSDIVTLVTDSDNIICLLSSKIEEVRSPVCLVVEILEGGVVGQSDAVFDADDVHGLLAKLIR